MNAYQFIQDLAVIMTIAGITTILCHFLRLPVVLGYIIAGIIIGPYTPPFSLINNQEIIHTLAELGVIFLMCSLGLDFDMRKLRSVGNVAFIAALIEIIIMFLLGYLIGKSFSWSATNSLFLGAMLSISSTTIIIKAIEELGLKKERFIQIIFGILIFEDVFGILILALITSIYNLGHFHLHHLLGAISHLAIFLTLSIFFGMLLIPRAISALAKFKSDELLLVTVLGCCFGFCLLVMRLGYSVALGAFLIGTIIAESREHQAIERLVQPLKHMFCAIFFVSVGLMFNPAVILTYALPITIITFVVIGGKFLAGTIGTFLAGKEIRTAMKVGSGLTQLGEFSLIIASLGLAYNVIDSFLYSIAVAVSAITTIVTPLLLKHSHSLTNWLALRLPASCLQFCDGYTLALRRVAQQISADIRVLFTSYCVNVLLYLSIFF